ncbi:MULTISPECIES: DUF1707 SHOCT-like domain-containing protein [Corynebacterium]|uniref:DUF1707 SHOCT-like domain-containing protein n=1 Tax=Corynebacterium TaxID=1716 RepID=UPI0008A8AD95|nr:MULTISPECIES: DUF1707 domain-containing protein [Corynebacterium]MDK8800339.1 DUF1707 domain-containing protein [Corynebacterium coyleae]MDK8824185.1 DUF1707 domain-containing protein [Corynebacterium coyleae]OHQ53761.1 hypothetical protein HMPREF2617_01945 [Corynebacterium sp. HMSC070H05]
MSTPYGNFRIGDQERMDAMDILGRALGEGRLDMAEFDNRCQAVAEAQTQQDLQPILGDLPTGRGGGVVDKQVSDDAVLYSQAEIMQARRSGRRTRAGVFWLGTIGSIGLVGLFEAVNANVMSGLSLLIIPTLFILLYVMKVGPDSWYTPSLRQLEQQRRQEIKRRQLEIEAAQVHQQALMRAQRKDQINQMTNDALNIAQDTVNRFRRK